MDKTFKDISTSPKNKTPLIYSHFDYTKRVKLREKLEYIFNELGIDNVMGIRDFILAEMVDIMTFILKKNKTKICASIEQYIPKSTLTAKIRESLLPTVIPQGTNYDEFEKGADSERIKILSLIDTLEVKEVDFENSMVCEAKWHDGFLLDYTQEQQDALLEKIGANVGDKIRVILIKE